MDFLCPLILFIYEYLVWQLDIPPWTTHSHHRTLFGPNTFFLLVQINTIPHLIGAFAFYTRRRWLMFIYLPYLLLFTIGQIFTWWLPYFFAKGLWHIDDNGEKLRDYQQFHSEHHKILPRFRNHPVIPDTEHTILFALTLTTIIFVFRAFYSKLIIKKTKNH